MKLIVKKGTTSKRVAIFIQNSSVTTGAGLTGLVFNSAGLTWYYWRENEGNVGATAVTLATATRGTYASGGFIEKDSTNMPGFYEIGIPDAALATGASWIVMQLKGATNMAQLTLEIQLVDYDPEDGAGLGLSRIDATISSRATPAQVNTEVVDAINVDAYTEPGQAAPPVSNSLVAKIQYLYKAFRNRTTQSASQYTLYGDDALTIHQKATFSDDGTTADRGEIASGP